MSYARLGDEILRRMTRKSGSSEMKPEYRLPLSVVGGAMVPVGLFWYGWSVQGGVHWIMAVVGTGIIGVGNCLIFVSSVCDSIVRKFEGANRVCVGQYSVVYCRCVRTLRSVCACRQYDCSVCYGRCITSRGTENVSSTRIGLGQLTVSLFGVGYGSHPGLIDQVWGNAQRVESREDQETMIRRSSQPRVLNDG